MLISMAYVISQIFTACGAATSLKPLTTSFLCPRLLASTHPMLSSDLTFTLPIPPLLYGYPLHLMKKGQLLPMCGSQELSSGLMRSLSTQSLQPCSTNYNNIMKNINRVQPNLNSYIYFYVSYYGRQLSDVRLIS